MQSMVQAQLVVHVSVWVSVRLPARAFGLIGSLPVRTLEASRRLMPYGEVWTYMQGGYMPCRLMPYGEGGQVGLQG